MHFSCNFSNRSDQNILKASKQLKSLAFLSLSFTTTPSYQPPFPFPHSFTTPILSIELFILHAEDFTTGQCQLGGYCEGGHGPPKKGKKRKKKKKKKKEKTNILHAVILNVHTMKFCVLELATLDSSNINIYLSDLYNTLGAKNQNGGCSWKIISAVVLESPKTHPPASTDTDAS